MLSELKELGIKIFMDDFGAEYSSLNCLHQLPIDVLKIDRVFAQTMSSRREYAAVIDAIIHLARVLDMKVVCKGIENLEQMAQINTLDCDYGQGYLFSKPLSVEEVNLYLDDQIMMRKSA